MSELINLLVVSPDAVLFQGQVEWAQLPLEDGLLGVWPGHAPLIASLAAGEVELGTADGISKLEVDGGTVRIDEDRCILLVGAPTDLAGDTDRIELFDEAEQFLEQELDEAQREEIGL